MCSEGSNGCILEDPRCGEGGHKQQLSQRQAQVECCMECALHGSRETREYKAQVECALHGSRELSTLTAPLTAPLSTL
jgi:hypothetical protein